MGVGRHSGDRVLDGYLVDFFEGHGHGSQVTSSWSSLVDAAQGGFGGGCTDPERRLLGDGSKMDRRLKGWEHRRAIRNALVALPARAPGSPAWGLVLYASHGPIPWARRLEDGEARGVSSRVFRKLAPSLYGVSVLLAGIESDVCFDAKPVRMSASKETKESERPRLVLTAAERFVVSLCLDSTNPGQSALRRVKDEASALLAEAVRLYRDAAGLPVDEPSQHRATRQPRARAVVSLVMGR